MTRATDALCPADPTDPASTPDTSRLPGDVDRDGDADLTDLAIAVAKFGRCFGDGGYDRRADLDGDDCVSLSDLAMNLAFFGQVCP